MVSAHIVLGRAKVDAGLAPVRRVHLREQAGRHLDHRNPALVGGRAEAGQIADDPSAQGDDVIRARRARRGQGLEDPFGLRHRLRRLTRGDDDRLPGAGGVQVERRHVRVAHAERPARAGRARHAEDALADPYRVGARPALGPDQPIGLGSRQAEQRVERIGQGVRGEHHRVGQLAVERLALGVETLELRLVAGERAVRALRVAPQVRRGNAQPDDRVGVEGLADGLRQHGAAAERDGRVALGEDPHHELGLAAAELLLPVRGEEVGDRAAQLLGEQQVGVHRVEARGLRVAQGPGLARPHEAGEDEGGVLYGRHPMRSR